MDLSLINFAPRAYAALFAIIIVIGCGGGGGGGGDSSSDSPPVISDLQFDPASAYQNQGNGTLTVTCSFNFTDQGKNVSTLHLEGSDGSTLSSPITGISGVLSGTVQVILETDTSTIGSYSVQVYVMDDGGHRSNTLTETFEIYADDTGANWSEQTLSSGGPLRLERVRWSGSLFITVGESGSIFTSPDAVTWTSQTSGIATMLNDVCWTGSQFIAVGNNGCILTSVDSQAWTTQVIPPAVISPTLSGVASSNTRIVVVGRQKDPISMQDTGLIMTSTDGITWTVVPDTIEAYLYAVIWAGNQFVAVGSSLNGGAIAITSSDGLAWSTHSITSTVTAIRDIAWNGSRYVAVGLDGALTSLDGNTWQQTANFASYAVAWSGHRFLAFGPVYAEHSTDGMNWTYTQMTRSSDVYGIAWNGAKWAVVGFNSLVATSP